MVPIFLPRFLDVYNFQCQLVVDVNLRPPPPPTHTHTFSSSPFWIGVNFPGRLGLATLACLWDVNKDSKFLGLYGWLTLNKKLNFLARVTYLIQLFFFFLYLKPNLSWRKMKEFTRAYKNKSIKGVLNNLKNELQSKKGKKSTSSIIHEHLLFLAQLMSKVSRKQVQIEEARGN